MGLALAVVGEDNVTVITLLEVGAVYPEIANITINGGNYIDLLPNSTVQVNVSIIVRDYNGEGDIKNPFVLKEIVCKLFSISFVTIILCCS